MSNVGRLDRIIRGSAGISIAFAELTGFLEKMTEMHVITRKEANK